MKNIWKYLIYSALAVLILAMGAATVLERSRGAEAALETVYHSAWFIALWAVTAVGGLIVLFREKVYTKPFTFGLHVALVLILAGAFVTFLTAERGELHLREGESASAFADEEGESVDLPFCLRLVSFRVSYYSGSRMPQDYISEVTVLPEGEPFTISMNHILKRKGYRFYQADYDRDELGSIFAVSHDPWGVGVTYAGYILLLVCMIGFFFQKNTRFRRLFASLSELPKGLKYALEVLAGLFLLLFFFLICRKLLFQPLMPVLRSPLLWVHVSAMIVSYAIFALLAIAGIAGLLVSRADLKEKLRNVGQTALYPAVFLLTFGTFIGAVWANISWGNYWAWDPKETWALITLLVYSVGLHGESAGILRTPRAFHWFAIIAFLCVIVTYFGVNFLLGGMHSYA